MSPSLFTVVQIGAREHYAVARALRRVNGLQRMLTDAWVRPGSALTVLPYTQRLQDRFHSDLTDAVVRSPTRRSLLFELASRRFGSSSGWERTICRNRWFQRWCITELLSSPPTALFAYSYAAGAIFQTFRPHGCFTVLGQIDPGQHEEILVAEEHRRYHHLLSAWKPAPAAYWEAWHRELNFADLIVVNSSWSLSCLEAQGVPTNRVRLVPLVFEHPPVLRTAVASDSARPFQLLFLGTICLRKGIGRLLEAMRLLVRHPVQLTLAGPTELDPQAWADVPNVRWIGPVPRSQVDVVYGNADAMILPTLSDGFALTQLEALSYGCPVIASQHCGDVVRPGRNGWLLVDLEPDSIADVICEAMDTVRDLPRALVAPDFSLQQLGVRLQSMLLSP